MMVVLVPSASLWAAGGTILTRWIASERSRRVLGAVLAVVPAATVAYIWI